MDRGGGGPGCPAPPRRQLVSTRPTASVTPSGGDACPDRWTLPTSSTHLFDPQQTGTPSAHSPQVWDPPLLMATNRSPSGGNAAPSPLPPQQTGLPSARSPQAWIAPLLTATNRSSSGGEAAPLPRSSPQQTGDPSERSPQAKDRPLLMEANRSPSGGAKKSWLTAMLYSSQQRTLPSGRSPQACVSGARYPTADEMLTEANLSLSGGRFDGAPQQRREPSARSPQIAQEPLLMATTRSPSSGDAAR